MMTTETNYLVHHGIKGQKWGVRRFQNLDGTRTAAGKARERNGEQESSSGSSQRKGLSDAQKSALKKVAIGAGVAAAAGLAVYGAMKYSDAIKNEAYMKTIEDGKEAIKALNMNTRAEMYAISGSKELTPERKSQLFDWHSAVSRREFEDVLDTASYNSSSFKNARAKLKGAGRMSEPELKKMGIATADSSREEFENYINSLIYNRKRS